MRQKKRHKNAVNYNSLANAVLVYLLTMINMLFVLSKVIDKIIFQFAQQILIYRT